jgi:NAD-dependent SIR2 family protein deacetylase
MQKLKVSLNSRMWECTICGYLQEWTYEQLAENGIPQCEKCDDDMSLIAKNIKGINP